MGRPATSDHLLSLKKPNLSRVWICNDAFLAEELEEAEEGLDLAKRTFTLGAPEVDQAETKVRYLKARVRENSVCWIFKAIGSKKYEALIDKHPPSQAQLDKHVTEGGEAKDVKWDPDVFPKALILASCVSPELNLDYKNKADLDEFCEWMESDNWNQGEVMAIFMGALEANSRVRGVNLGNA